MALQDMIIFFDFWEFEFLSISKNIIKIFKSNLNGGFAPVKVRKNKFLCEIKYN